MLNNTVNDVFKLKPKWVDTLCSVCSDLPSEIWTLYEQNERDDALSYASVSEPYTHNFSAKGLLFCSLQLACSGR